MHRFSLLGAALAVVLAVAVQLAPAQDLRGKIGGTVTDASGAVIPGVGGRNTSHTDYPSLLGVQLRPIEGYIVQSNRVTRTSEHA